MLVFAAISRILPPINSVRFSSGIPRITNIFKESSLVSSQLQKSRYSLLFPIIPYQSLPIPCKKKVIECGG